MGEPGKFYLEIAQILQPPFSPPPPLPHVIKSTNYQIEKRFRWSPFLEGSGNWTDR